jgi:hypothetical protein
MHLAGLRITSMLLLLHRPGTQSQAITQRQLYGERLEYVR